MEVGTEFAAVFIIATADGASFFIFHTVEGNPVAAQDGPTLAFAQKFAGMFILQPTQETFGYPVVYISGFGIIGSQIRIADVEVVIVHSCVAGSQDIVLDKVASR